MKTLLFSLLFITAIGSFDELKAQTLSIDETKKILVANKWFLRRYEQDGKYYTVPVPRQGLRMVFKTDGTTYSYLPSEKEAEAKLSKWTIKKDELIIQGAEKTVYKYKLEDFIGYKLYLVDQVESDMPTYVFEKAEKIEKP